MSLPSQKVSCSFCRSRKVKCILSPDSSPPSCTQCIRHNQSPCTFVGHMRGRRLWSKNGTRSSSNASQYSPHEQSTPMLSQAQPPIESSPLFLLVEAFESTLAPTIPRRVRTPNQKFKSKPDICLGMDPIDLGMVCERMATDLLEFFWANIQAYSSLLDPQLHTLPDIRARSSLLLTVILYVSARLHPPITQVPGEQDRLALLSYTLERHLFCTVWPRVLTGNFCSVEICQACMIWATHLGAVREGEDDLSWGLFGHAIRIAVEIGLNCDPPIVQIRNEQDRPRAIRNAERVWMTCFIADRSWAIQLGRPPMIAEDARFLRADEWLDHPLATLEDKSIVALIMLRRILYQAQSSSNTNPMNQLINNTALDEWKHRWLQPANKTSYRLGHIGPIYYFYAKILLGLQSNTARDQGQDLMILGNAAELLSFAAQEMPRNVYSFAHNNLFTMLSFGAAIFFCLANQSLGIDRLNSTFTHIEIIKNQILDSIQTTPHNAGVHRWHATLLGRFLDSEKVKNLATQNTTAVQSAMDIMQIGGMAESLFPEGMMLEDQGLFADMNWDELHLGWLTQDIGGGGS